MEPLARGLLSAAEIDALERLLVEGEDWIVQRVIDYATELGYAKYASSVREAWCVAVRGLTTSFIEALRHHSGNLEIHADEDVCEDPAISFGIREAGLHRSRGVDFSMFLGLMKYNEQAFTDFIDEHVTNAYKRRHYCQLVKRLFDRIEIGFSAEWSGLSAEKAVEELRERNVLMTTEKDLYLRFFETVNVPMIVLDLDGRVKNLNASAASMFGIEGVEGSVYYSRAGADASFAPLSEDIERFIANGGVETMLDRTLETADGLRHFTIRIQGLVNVAGECTDIIIVMGDVTNRRQLELELEQKVAERTEDLERANQELVCANQVKSEFLAAMSHELRTPLNSVLGFSTLMRRGLAGPVNEEQERQLGMIVSSGEHLLRLVNDVLDLAAVEAGRLQIMPTEFELSGLCASMAGMLRPLADAQGIELRCGPSCDETQVFADRDKAMQILLNLTSNAIKFTDHGYVDISCTLDTERDLAFVSVSDSGRGIAAEDFEHIFDDFRRGVPTVAHGGEGIGLGLAISRRLARLLGGDIELDSVLGEGSTFTLVLPTRYVAEEAEPA
ncbi:MAG: ATP-binding protein [Coriobacteriia bacterium]|nr:ATP-binding protein [Coriobacteriia bacterium]